ncbi:mitochondrial substrate carrier family protein [Cavenderia fasciculata]|uniref:Mitochondrial substrate carrier family protein n=1 Tax=Cavenderia fasciculata TaxID=261658 RepID=F4PTG2_CACFS|nr:mitochondrial substrate carrier family protein [Cavenderia fasciculata]EGG21684.1 mitochondrial substrate carrier family protein [Cavenderia fasciculata]|eukprot:XP_004359534.1 mitochondrial substrate carrier family protein [Cavenderia fasciculata]
MTSTENNNNNSNNIHDGKSEKEHADAIHSQHFKTELIAGAMSGALTRCIVAPLDVVKIRFQLQKHDTSHAHQSAVYKSTLQQEYSGVFQTLSKITREEGYRALWKGNLTAEILWISYGAAQFACYSSLNRILDENYTKNICKDEHYKPPPIISLVSGGLSSAAATLLSYPFDTIRTNIVSKKHHVSIYETLKELEKTRSIYNGVGSSLLQIVPLMALQFTFYETLKHTWINLRTNHGNASTQTAKADPVGQFICGGLSGAMSKFLVLPLDVIKKRLQVSKGSTMHYTITTMYRYEGWKSFFKGAIPSLIKAGCSSSLSFMFNNTTTQILKN